MIREVDHVARAYELLRLERYELALQEVGQALAADPRAAEAHIAGAWALRDQGRFAEAEDAARAALAAAPHLPAAHNVLACVHWRAGRRAPADAAFGAMLACPPPVPPEFLTNYARFLVASVRPAEALALAEQALAGAPGLAIAHEVRGHALADLSRREEAGIAYRAALRIDPRNFNAQHRLGQVALAEGQVEAALDLFREALRLRPGDASARAGLVLALKTRQPLYGRLLTLVLRCRSARVTRLFWTAIVVLFFVRVFLVGMTGEGTAVDRVTFYVWVWLIYGFLALPFAGLVWRGVVDPIFNTLLLLDPLGRQVVDYDVADGIHMGALGALLLGGLGWVAGAWLLGPMQPVTAAGAALAGAGALGLLLPADRRAAPPGWRRAIWAGYAGIVAGVGGMTAGLVAAATPLSIGGAGLLDGGLIVYLIAWLASRPRRAGAGAPDRGWRVVYLAGLLLCAGLLVLAGLLAPPSGPR